MKKWIIIAISFVLVLVADLVSKHFLFDVDYYNLIPHVISIAGNGGNTGAAFGMFSGNTVWLILVSIIMIVALFIFNHYIKSTSVMYSLGFGFVIGGAVGNLCDRIFLGYVRDFIYLDFWSSYPTFNLADSFLVIGVVMLGIYIVFFHNKSRKNG